MKKVKQKSFEKIPEKKLWFKAKCFGWGWYPCSWEGWLVTLIYAFGIFIFATTIDDSSSTREIFFTFIFPMALLTLVLIRIAYRKGEKPSWRWGCKV